jgi:hypothetical protein
MTCGIERGSKLVIQTRVYRRFGNWRGIESLYLLHVPMSIEGGDFILIRDRAWFHRCTSQILVSGQGDGTARMLFHHHL